MKRFAVLSAIIAVGIGSGVVAQQGGFTLPPPDPIEQITDRLYKIEGGFAGNTIVFLREDGVVMVDTKTNGTGEAVMAEIRKVTDLPITTIVNTHAHPDHIGGNSWFRQASPTVEVVMHENAAAAAGTPAFGEPTLSDFTFSDRMTLGTGDDRVDLYYFGPGHTNGDTIVVFPTEKAMMLGDLMAWDMGGVVDTQSGGSALEMPATLDGAVQALEGKIDIVIEGHAQLNSWSGFLRYVSYTHKIVDVARRGVAADMNYVEAYDAFFATDPAMAHYTGEEIFPGFEYGGTPKTRTLNNLYIAMAQLRGEDVGLVMGAPPAPGE